MKDQSSSFIWDFEKELENVQKHGIDFITAAQAFRDPQRKIFVDAKHSKHEERLYCLGKVAGKVLTVRFTYRGSKVRIIGAGFWRKGVSYYEKEDN